ncbi:MAG TPA: hypothetical protein VGY91_13370 [Chthoniobacterales bacterium]|jgi:hypothetical protein|nr:hypothetical protein [Chthoniobacterales bacterium]
MLHLIWYVLIGLISGVIVKSGIIESINGGGVSHMFSLPTNERYHPAGSPVFDTGPQS